MHKPNRHPTSNPNFDHESPRNPPFFVPFSMVKPPHVRRPVAFQGQLCHQLLGPARRQPQGLAIGDSMGKLGKSQEFLQGNSGKFREIQGTKITLPGPSTCSLCFPFAEFSMNNLNWNNWTWSTIPKASQWLCGETCVIPNGPLKWSAHNGHDF